VSPTRTSSPLTSLVMFPWPLFSLTNFLGGGLFFLRCFRFGLGFRRLFAGLGGGGPMYQRRRLLRIHILGRFFAGPQVNAVSQGWTSEWHCGFPESRVPSSKIVWLGFQLNKINSFRCEK
jgi:hypothetical protein